VDFISTAGVAVRENKYFIARRKPGTSIGRTWEFPGGKAKEGEKPESALEREFYEELGLKITIGKFICSGEFRNKGKKYKLFAYFIDFDGNPRLLEHDECRWASLEEMKALEFPESDKIIIKTLLQDTVQSITPLEKLLDDLEKNPDFTSKITHWEKIAPREGRYTELPADLHQDIQKALTDKGIKRLYSHQNECYHAVRKGSNVVVVTPTASGKTLCYNLPVLQTLMENPEARALYLFPTKALSQDQQAELNEIIIGGSISVKINTYDGDTPSSVRVAARDAGRIIISNPDMLHTGILPNHPKWIKFLSALKFIVIDEIHIYRGVFGSHMTNVIRRLKRIARFYNTEPQFICCSATIGNPLELSRRIIEEDAVLVDDNGAPAGEKNIVLYNPPLVDQVQGIRRGVVNESRNLALDFLKKHVKTIVFARSRMRTELIASYINKSLSNIYNQNRGIRVESYRGGYLPGERRSIEKGLRDGSIQGVVSTNALELGIDIGGLDVSILAGLPGSIASAWQQAGRAGRRNTKSLAVMIASASPIDQYMIRHPEYFFAQSPESGWVDPDNLFILMDHLKCAVFELPFSRGEDFGGLVDELLPHLEEKGIIRFSGGKWYWADRSYPAEQISLRSATSDNVVIIDTTKGRNNVIGEMDRPSAKELLFDQAIYIHRGSQYVVTELDMENQKCFVTEAEVNYYTDSIVKTDIHILQEDSKDVLSDTSIILGDVLVRTQVTKYKKIRYHSHESIGYGDIFLHEEEMHTRCVVILFSPETQSGKAFAGLSTAIREHVIAGIGTLIKNVAPVFLLCDPRDIGVAERLRDPHFTEPALYIYDKYPGGIGLSEGFFSQTDVILQASYDHLLHCSCSRGCPSCIGPEGNFRNADFTSQDKKTEENPKEALIKFFALWLGNSNEPGQEKSS